MEKELKAGDVVKMKSGSVEMTITDIFKGHNGQDAAKCYWQDAGKVHYETIPTIALEKI